MTHNIPDLDSAGLRRFGLVTAAMTCGVFGLFLPLVFHKALPLWPWAVGASLALWSLVAPASLRLVYVVWMRIGLLIGGIMNPVILAIVFFVLISPLGILLRMFGHDPMGSRRDASTTTYRTASRKLSAKNMERPF